MSLEQYYTEERIGERLVSLLPLSELTPARCIELSAGEGALLRPVIKQWPGIAVATCELDPCNHAKLVQSFAGEHYKLDVMSPEFEIIAKTYFEQFELAVCNPPFLWREITDYDRYLLSFFHLGSMQSWKRVRGEVIFILQNIRILKNNGYMAIILPELIVRSSLFSEFRRSLLKFCSICAISEVEAGGFKGTEARTYIVVIRKNSCEHGFRFLFADGEELELSQEAFVRFEISGDARFISQNVCLDVVIKRGAHSGKEIRESGLPYYHTTGFHGSISDELSEEADGMVVKGKKAVVACEGDVLIHRVGSRTVGKVSIVESGAYLVSDCVFRVNLPDNICPLKVRECWEYIIPSVVKEARGTCAKYITKNDVVGYLEEIVFGNIFPGGIKIMKAG